MALFVVFLIVFKYFDAKRETGFLVVASVIGMIWVFIELIQWGIRPPKEVETLTFKINPLYKKLLLAFIVVSVAMFSFELWGMLIVKPLNDGGGFLPRVLIGFFGQVALIVLFVIVLKRVVLTIHIEKERHQNIFFYGFCAILCFVVIMDYFLKP